MGKFFLYILVLVLLEVSCKEEKIYRPDIVADLSVQIIPAEESLKMSSFFKTTYDIIVPEGVVLAGVSKVLVKDSLMIVEGKTGDGFIHLFDKKGQFIETILKRGGGPSEAANIWAMKIYNDNVYFLVNAGTEIMCYSLTNRKVIDRFRMPNEIVSIADFEILSDKEFIFYKNLTGMIDEDEFKLYMFDRERKEVIERWIPLHAESSEYISFAQHDCLYYQDGRIRFYEVFQKGIYELEEKQLKGYVSFEDNEYAIPDNELYGRYTFDSFIDFCMRSPYVWAHRGVMEGSRFIFSNYTYREKYYWNVIDKKKGKSKSFLKIDDDIFLEEKMLAEDYPFQTNKQDSVQYFTISYDQLADVMEKKRKNGSFDSFSKSHPEVVKIYEKSSIDTNDLIIMLYEEE